MELPFPPQPPCIFHNLCTYITILGPGTGYTGYLNKVWQLKNLFKTVTLPSWNVYMLWFNFILGLNFISICFKLIIIHYQTPKQRELKFKPRIKYDPQQIYATNYKMWVIFSPESTVRPIFELSYPIKTIRLSMNEFQNGRELRWLCIIFSFKNGKMFIKKNQDLQYTEWWRCQASEIGWQWMILSKLAPQNSEIKGSTLMLHFFWCSRMPSCEKTWRVLASCLEELGQPFTF